MSIIVYCAHCNLLILAVEYAFNLSEMGIYWDLEISYVLSFHRKRIILRIATNFDLMIFVLMGKKAKSTQSPPFYEKQIGHLKKVEKTSIKNILTNKLIPNREFHSFSCFDLLSDVFFCNFNIHLQINL